jgi:nitroreductase/NAD-dependent dihydropyrimidine dehydrogenase PreA subunit
MGNVIEIDAEKCTRCGACFEVCPSETIGLRNIEGKKEAFEKLPDTCIQCGHCVAVCEAKAISNRLLSDEDFEELEPVEITSHSMRNLLLARRSVRVFRKDPVPDEVVGQLIEVGAHAGTGGNAQSVGFTVVKDADLLDRLEIVTQDVLWNSLARLFDVKWLVPLLRLKFGSERTEQIIRYRDSMRRKRENDEMAGWIFRGAPVVILAHDVKNNEMGQVNCAIAIRNIEIMAMTLELGSCWAGFFIMAANQKPGTINPMIQLDENRRVWGALMIGHPRYKYAYKLPRATRSITVPPV